MEKNDFVMRRNSQELIPEGHEVTSDAVPEKARPIM